ncbi:AAA family ATPase [Comamonas terrigena]|uniref:UvrD-helicase domain-containing protein n=1 Tax=Comamonas terrigena TaxID=32013 RepID=UPI00244BCC91|nr:UvrD-helicase domain-containing protein [Comamonas terrigena]MDH1291798.1 AAA family ATPase [Comamonas terrigena]
MHKFGPTLEQQQILQSASNAILIEALAGTGKTTALCMKACKMLAGTHPDVRILMLAYSRAGVTAIRDRLNKLNGVVPPRLEILTVEELSESVLREQGDPVHKMGDPVRRRNLILQAQQALRQELARNRNRGLDALLEHDVDIDAFLACEALIKKCLLDKQLDESGLSLRAFCEERDLDYGLYRLIRHYERMRVGLNHEPQFYAEGDCTFELSRQLDLLDWDQPFEWLQGRYGAVLFDELHDLDEGALMILRKLVQSNNGVFVGAGDFNQHIEEGAFSVFGEAMQRIKECLPEDTQVLRINTTRRFGAEICAALNPMFGVHFSTMPDSSDMFQHLTYDTDKHCAQQLVELHAQIVNGWGVLHGEKSQHSNLNIILRNPQDSILLEWIFGHEGVHYGCQGLRPFYLRREVALVLTLMWALQGSEANRCLTPGILNAALQGLQHYGYRSKQTEAINADVLASGNFDEASLAPLAGASETPKIVGMLFGNTLRTRQFITRGPNPDALEFKDSCAAVMALSSDVLGDAGAFFRHPKVLQIFNDAQINSKERQACLASLERLAILAKGMPASEFLGRLTLMATASIAMHERKEVVTLRFMSVTASKGREFTFVAVPFVERGRFPAPVPRDEAYRERNMLYVAMTRAHSALWLLEGRKRPVTPGPV